MNGWLDCIQIWYDCFLGISDDLINFWDESINNKMAATAILKTIDMVVMCVIFLIIFMAEGSCHQLMAIFVA